VRRYQIVDICLGFFEGETPYEYLGLFTQTRVCEVRRYQIVDICLGFFEGDTPYKYFNPRRRVLFV
jgi:hypothetical protein